MACEHLNSKTSYSYADLLTACIQAGLVFQQPDELFCRGVDCTECPFTDNLGTPFANAADCSDSSLAAILAYHRAGLIDISEHLI